MTRQCPACGFNLAVIDRTAAVGDLSVSLYGDCRWNGHKIKLAPQELQLVFMLASSPNVFFRLEAIINAISSEDVNIGLIATLICRARAKFRAVDPDFDRIETSKGRGARWRADAVS